MKRNFPSHHDDEVVIAAKVFLLYKVNNSKDNTTKHCLYACTYS